MDHTGTLPSKRPPATDSGGVTPGITTAVEVEGVTKRFRSTTALDNVSVSVEAGKVLALLGPNGAGKTTLIRILTTLLTPDAGHARIAGLDVQKDARAIRSLIGLAGQYAIGRRALDRPRES